MGDWHWRAQDGDSGAGAAEAHAVIRKEATAEIFGEEFAAKLRRHSLRRDPQKPDNVSSLMAQEEIDGALVGGSASLDPASFAKNREAIKLTAFLSSSEAKDPGGNRWLYRNFPRHQHRSPRCSG